MKTVGKNTAAGPGDRREFLKISAVTVTVPAVAVVV